MQDQPLKRYHVTEAGENNWNDVDAADAGRAGEIWAEARWRPSVGPIEYELDVRGPDGELLAVTVDVDMDVSFSGFATKHPCANEAGSA